MRNDKAKTTTCMIDGKESVFWNWANGETDEVLLSELPAITILKLTLFGLKTKLSNTYAGEPILSASRKNFLRGLQSLTDGIWTTGTTRISMLARAVARVRGIAIEDAIESIAKLDKKDVKKLRDHSGVKYAMAKIQLEDAETDGTGDAFDLDDFLGD